MPAYLLLRNNKEMGPFQLEELLTQGLKPYDLVWVEGKSAAWRYPSEINELKPYAPAVEEQPFDRFFKKPVTNEASLDQDKKMAVPVKEENKINKTYSDYLPKDDKATDQQKPKTVFVKLPVQRPGLTASAAKVEEKTSPVPSVQEKWHQTSQPVNNKPLSSVDVLQEDYTRKLEDRKQKIARKNQLHILAKRAAVIAALLGLGVLLGFVLRPKDKNQGDQAQHNPIATPLTTAPSLALAENNNEVVLPPAEENQQISGPNETGGATAAIPGREDKKIAEKLDNPQPLSQKQLNTLKLTKENMVATPAMERAVEEKYAYNSSETNQATGERNKAVRSEQSETVMMPKTKEASSGKTTTQEENTAWSKLVELSSNDYKKVPIGGIRNLELTLTNKSASALDKVIVELQYLRPNDQPVKTENLTFKSIPAKESVTMKIPDTNRGVKVTYRILRVDSKDGDGIVIR